MKPKLQKTLMLLSCALATIIIAGCAQQQQRASVDTTPAYTTKSEPAPTPAPAPKPSGGYGPSYTTYEQDGLKWTRGSMAFPTGLRESSGLLVEKSVPAEVLAGQPFTYTYKVSNLTDYALQLVTLSDRVTKNFNTTEANPKPTDTKDGVATWNIGNLGPKESKTITLKGSSAEEGSITTCGWASYSPILCEDIRIVKAALQLVKNAPPEVVICDPIPMTLTVKNTGSSALTAVKVQDTLPQGLVSDGKTSLTFDAGDLAPGATKEFKFNATASAKGKFVNNAKASSAQGVTAEASSTTVVREPALAITCTAPEQRYMARPFDVCFTVANKGDAPSAGTTVKLPLPAGVSLRSATEGGQAAGSTITWNVGALAPNATKQVCATVVSSAGGTFEFAASAQGSCAKPVTTSCKTVVVGISALLLEKADDPDPISVGENTTYTVKVTNQGTADDTNIKMVVEFPDEVTPVSASNSGVVDGKKVTFPAYPRLAPKAAFTYTIKAKGEKVGDARIRFVRTSDGIPAPTSAEESTRVY